NCTIAGRVGESKVYSWGAAITVKNQQICAVPSTLVNSTLLATTDLCTDQNRMKNESVPQCFSRRGGPISRLELHTVSTAGLEELTPGWNMIMKPDHPFQYAVEEELELRADYSVQMKEGLITQGNNHTTSRLGLGDRSSLLQAM